MTGNKQHILVTGGAGFIGSHVVEDLIGRGAMVTVADRWNPGRPNPPAEVSETIRALKLDIRSEAFVEHLKEEPYAAILHLAGPASVPLSVEDPYRNFEDSLHATIQLLEILRKHCPQTRLIVASSASVYGNPVSLPMAESDPTNPISPYGVAKLALERYTAVYSQLYGLPAASLRFFSLYGPRQRKMLVYDLICKLHRNPEALTLLGTGAETRDFIYVKDAVRAMITILESGPLMGEVYNVATGQPHTTLEVARAVAKALNATPEITFTGRGRAGDPDRWWADIEKIRHLGFSPQMTLDEGIQETVDWYHCESGTIE